MAGREPGDDFYVRAHFNYDQPEHGEAKFQHGDVFHVTDTLYGGVVGSWQARKVGPNHQETQRCVIPNKTRCAKMFYWDLM